MKTVFEEFMYLYTCVRIKKIKTKKTLKKEDIP